MQMIAQISDVPKKIIRRKEDEKLWMSKKYTSVLKEF